MAVVTIVRFDACRLARIDMLFHVEQEKFGMFWGRGRVGVIKPKFFRVDELSEWPGGSTSFPMFLE